MSNIATQKAVYVALSAALAPIRVFDKVPQNSNPPYVVLDAQDIDHADYLASIKYKRRIYLSIWSEYSGQKEVLEILDTINMALHRQRLPMESGRMINCLVTRSRTKLDADGETYMGSVTLEIHTE